MGKKWLLTLLVLACLSVLTGKRSYTLELPVLSEVGFDRPEVRPDPVLEPLLESFEDFVRYRLEEEGVPGAAIAIVKDSNLIYLNTFGLKENLGYDSIDIHTVFRLASVSKGFAPVLTGMLVEEGVLDWDDRVVDYLPDFQLRSARQTEALTLRHVLSHTTGLPRHTYSNLLDDGVPYPEIRERLQQVRLTHGAGEFYNYQNVAYSLIGDIVEAATGKSYQALLQEKIFAPLEMKDASASYEEMVYGDNFALPHRRRYSHYEPTDLSRTYYDVSPAAGVNASITDLSRWLRFLLGHRPDLLSEKTLAEVFRPHVDIPWKDKTLGNWRSLMDRAHYALGWRVLECGPDELIYHGGYVNSFRAEVALLPADGLGIAVLSNAPSRFISDCLPVFFELYQDFQRERVEALPPFLSLR